MTPQSHPPDPDPVTALKALRRAVLLGRLRLGACVRTFALDRPSGNCAGWFPIHLELCINKAQTTYKPLTKAWVYVYVAAPLRATSVGMFASSLDPSRWIPAHPPPPLLCRGANHGRTCQCYGMAPDQLGRRPGTVYTYT